MCSIKAVVMSVANYNSYLMVSLINCVVKYLQNISHQGHRHLNSLLCKYPKGILHHSEYLQNRQKPVIAW